MSYFICVSPLENPCQPANQIAVTEVTLNDLAALGITPQSVGTAVAAGFGLVLVLAMLGFVIGAVLRLIRLI